jgi:hypothetical protein
MASQQKAHKTRHERKLIMFEPGVVYLAYGENCYVRPELYHVHHAYKIGATRKLPGVRIRSAWSSGWEFRRNIRLLHTIQVDNMRVVEMMFHMRFADRSAVPMQPWREWFVIDDNVPLICSYQSINVAAALTDLSGDGASCDWWRSMTIKDRRKVTLSLWQHPALHVVCSAVGNKVPGNIKIRTKNTIQED